MSTMTRREFVHAAAVLAAAVAAAGAGGCAPDLGIDADGEVEMPSRNYGGGVAMSGRVLVGYATRTGSTVGVAEAIGKQLASRGFEVDVKPLRERPSVDGYDAAVLGSAINGGGWLPEALGFVENNKAALASIPVAAFCVHAMNAGPDEKQTRKRLAYLDKVRALVTPADEGFFLGKGPDADDTSFIARWAFKAFGGSGEGDMRDWDTIRTWAEEVRV